MVYALGRLHYPSSKFNHKVVDMVFFASIDQKKRTAQCRWDPNYSLETDTETAFFAELDRWLPELGSFKVETPFLWIYEGNRYRAEIEATLNEERRRLCTVMHRQNHKVY